MSYYWMAYCDYCDTEAKMFTSGDHTWSYHVCKEEDLHK